MELIVTQKETSLTPSLLNKGQYIAYLSITSKPYREMKQAIAGSYSKKYMGMVLLRKMKDYAKSLNLYLVLFEDVTPDEASKLGIGPGLYLSLTENETETTLYESDDIKQIH